MSLADGWEWITGEPFVYTNWAWGEPNDTPFGTYIAGSEQNLEVYQGSGKWNDAPGWDPWWEPKYHYIVEYEDCYLPAGKAIFSLVAKYKKGASEPTGNVRFRLKAADLDFRSTGLDWLTVADDYAKCLGEGTINGEGGYHFLLWVSDGEPDTFQIGIWHEDGGGVIVYDNGMGQAIGGGNIVVHSE
jgi:hypothetical protein